MRFSSTDTNVIPLFTWLVLVAPHLCVKQWHQNPDVVVPVLLPLSTAALTSCPWWTLTAAGMQADTTLKRCLAVEAIVANGWECAVCGAVQTQQRREGVGVSAWLPAPDGHSGHKLKLTGEPTTARQQTYFQCQ